MTNACTWAKTMVEKSKEKFKIFISKYSSFIE
jgi:hypothetical protein